MFRVCLCLCLAACGSTALAADEYLDAVMADNPIAYWAFEEDTGDFYDEVTGTPNALRGATTAMVAGPIGTGFVEDNPAINTGGVATGVVTVLDGGGSDYDVLTDDWTIEAWIQFPETPWTGVQAPIGKVIETSYCGYAIQVLDRVGDGAIIEVSSALRVGASGWYTSSYMLPWEPIPGDTAGWHHIVASFDRDVGSQLFWDGELLIESDLVPGTGPIDNNIEDVGNNLTFGEKAPFEAQYFTGGIDEVALYRTALVEAQVTAHYAAAGLGPIIPEPTVWVLMLAGAFVLFARKCFKIGRGK